MGNYFEPNLSLSLPGKDFYSFGDSAMVRPLNIANIKQLSLAIYNDDIGLLERTVADCVNFDINELYLSDWWYLLWWLRLNSYKNFPMQVTYTCPHCGGSHTYTITTESLQYQEIMDGLDLRTVRIKLDNFEKEMRVRPPKVGDESKIRKLLKSKLVNLDSPSGKSTLECMRALAVLETEDMTLEEIYVAYRNNKFTADDSMTLDAFVDMAHYGVKDEFLLKCPTCNEEVPVAVDIRPLDFFPTHTTNSFARKRVLLRSVDTPAVE